MVVGVLLAIDLAIMTTWQVSDPFYRATKQMDPYVRTYLYRNITLGNIINVKVRLFRCLSANHA